MQSIKPDTPTKHSTGL